MTRPEILARYDLIDGPELIVEAIQGGTVWRVSIHAIGNPTTALLPSKAIELSKQLRQIGENKLADRIELEANKARRYQSGDALKMKTAL
jgi:hypothetical protein